jgi:glycosyltransferase involved in cell wall biosynthesis
MLPFESRQRLAVARVAFVQDGSRRSYLVPATLQEVGLLERAFCDWYVLTDSGEERFAQFIRLFADVQGRRMLERTSPALDPAKLVRNGSLALWLRLRKSLFADEDNANIWAARRSANWIVKTGFGDANVLYGFIRNTSPEAFRAARQKGLRTVGEQFIATAEAETRQIREQQSRWPGWDHSVKSGGGTQMSPFEQETWDALDHITCMSDYVADTLVESGVERRKISVLPYPYQPSAAPPDRRSRKGPLHVGFVGGLNLRKGAPYFLETARRFDPAKFRFSMVGNMQLRSEMLAPYRRHVHFAPSVARSEIPSWMDKFDVFLFPSTCEGSAGAVMEAMANGLPVLTTRESGTRVRHGMEGFVYRYDDLDGFEAAIHRLSTDGDLRVAMGDAARARAMSYTTEAYGDGLAELFAAIVEA